MLYPDISKLAIYHKIIDPANPTIIFLHDSLGCIELWKDFPEKLATEIGYNFFIYDRMGYGKSCPFTYKQRPINYLDLEADILFKLIEHYKLKNIVLFGHSDGGTIALIAASKFKNLINKIITVGAHVFVEDVTINGIKNAANSYKNTNLKEKLIKYHGNKTDDLFYAWINTWTNDSFRNWNIVPLLKEIECPVLIIQGSEDEYGTLKQVDKIYHSVNYSEASIITGAKHSPHKEVPEKIIAICKNFINKDFKEKIKKDTLLMFV
jgi:pimeloyl-ACP methyl ester carboxylesterase